MEKCESCGNEVQIGSWPFCPHEMTGWRARIADLPVVVYKNAAGEVRFPGSASEPMPRNYKKQGFQRVEMTYHEARTFQKEFNKAERARISDKKEFEHYLASVEQAEDRSDLLHEMSKMSPQGREFAEYVIEQNNQRNAKAFYSQDPGFYLEILE